MLTRRAALLIPLLLPAVVRADEPPASRVVAQMQRYLRAIQFGETFQDGIRKANAVKGSSSKFLDRLLAAKPEQIEAALAPVFAAYVTLDQARDMTDFYSSPLGQKLLVQGRARIDEPRIVPTLTPAEQVEFDRVSQTKAFRIAGHLTHDPGIRQQYFDALKRAFAE